jgi:hypothetical protein
LWYLHGKKVVIFCGKDLHSSKGVAKEVDGNLIPEQELVVGGAPNGVPKVMVGTGTFVVNGKENVVPYCVVVLMVLEPEASLEVEDSGMTMVVVKFDESLGELLKDHLVATNFAARLDH